MIAAVNTVIAAGLLHAGDARDVDDDGARRRHHPDPPPAAAAWCDGVGTVLLGCSSTSSRFGNAPTRSASLPERRARGFADLGRLVAQRSSQPDVLRATDLHRRFRQFASEHGCHNREHGCMTRVRRDRERADPVRAVHGARAVRRGGLLHACRRGSAGRRGDFITSPEVGPLFGAVLGPLPRRRVGTASADRTRSPSSTPAPARGRSPGRCSPPGRPALEAMRYVAVEVSPAQRERHPAGVESRAELPAEPVRRRRHRQRAARQPAVPARRVRRRMARGVRRRRRRRSVRRGAVGATRPGAAVLPPPHVRRRPGAARRRAPRRSSTTPAGCVRAGTVLVHRLRRRRDRPSSRCGRGVSGCARTAARARRSLPRRPGQPGHHHRRAVRPAARARRGPYAGAVPASAGASTTSSTKGCRVWTEQAARPGLEAMRMRSRVARGRGAARPRRPRRLPRHRVAALTTATVR